VKLDLHVHAVGNGSSGSGCWYRPRGWTRVNGPILRRTFGLPAAALRGDLDRLYAERLLALVRASSLDAVVLLAQDLPHEASGRPRPEAGSFHVPNDYVLDLAARHPEFLAGVSIHPARADALAELDRCLARGAVLLKCLPNCQNIDWGDRRYTRFLERMAAAGLPLLAHTGSERALPVVAPHLADPAVLRRPLEIGVRCIAAHCGTGSWADRSYFDTFARMIEAFPELYGDNSAFALPCGRLRARCLERCLAPPLRDRILHGSDTPVPILVHEARLRGYLSREQFRALARERNPLERDYRFKRALGFPDSSFTRAAELLRLPAARVPAA